MERIDQFNDDLREAVATLRRGGIILYPTDTVWGIGCDAANPEAVARVYKIKNRVDSKALITLVDSVATLERYVEQLPEVAEQLIEVATRPLTIVYDNGINLAPNLLALDGSIGIRVTGERFSRELCRAFRRPVVSTSANISGQPTPGCFAEIEPEILEAVDYVVTYRRDEKTPAIPSSVIKLGNDSSVTILRS